MKTTLSPEVPVVPRLGSSEGYYKTSACARRAWVWSHEIYPPKALIIGLVWQVVAKRNCGAQLAPQQFCHVEVVSSPSRGKLGSS